MARSGRTVSREARRQQEDLMNNPFCDVNRDQQHERTLDESQRVQIVKEKKAKMKIDLGEAPERENRKASDSKIRKPASQDVGMNKTGGCKSIE